MEELRRRAVQYTRATLERARAGFTLMRTAAPAHFALTALRPTKVINANGPFESPAVDHTLNFLVCSAAVSPTAPSWGGRITAPTSERAQVATAAAAQG